MTATRIRRLDQVILIGSTLLACWLGMQAVHEFGHVVGAWLTGGRVEKVVLDPLSISRTDVAPNPRPLVVAWAGPVVGVLLPLALWGIAVWLAPPVAWIVRFFAGFCLVANGAYIAFGSLARVGDAGDLLRHAAPPWTLWIFGMIAIPAGFSLWHRQGPNFGFGEAHGHVDRRAAIIAVVACIVLLALSLAVAACNLAANG